MNEGAIETTDIRFVRDSGEAGTIHEVTCPDCSDTVAVAPSAWWRAECACGRVWSLEMYAVGRREAAE